MMMLMWFKCCCDVADAVKHDRSISYVYNKSIKVDTVRFSLKHFKTVNISD